MESFTDIRSMNMEELTAAVTAAGEKKFRAKQIYGWLHQKLIRTGDEMKNVPASCRQTILKDHPLYGVTEVERYVSKIDGTTKFLFELHDGNIIESVLMKYRHGNSVCISSQAGCRMGCGYVPPPCWDWREICTRRKCLTRFTPFREPRGREFLISW